MEYKFPDNFKWGSATSSHQIEGDNHNDWSEWEKSRPADFVSGKACDSYNRYPEDFDIAKQLNQNIHRFSIEWSRIEPEEGKFDSNAIQHYKDVVKSIRDRGMEPMITLWHFTNPVWFSKKGGWAGSGAPEAFLRFIKVVVDNFSGQKVGYWATFNEATTVYNTLSYMRGVWPPQEKSIFKFLRVRRNILKAHTLAYRYIKDTSASTSGTPGTDGVMSHNVQVGLVENLVYIPDTKNIFKTKLRRIYKRIRNFYLINGATPYYDFIGLNYYHMERRPRFSQKDELVPSQGLSDMGWELYPPGIYHCLMDLKKYKKPVFITENGIDDSTDHKREKFIKDNLYWIWKAIQDGADVRGYFYWSLLDNFEWWFGYGPKFGLVEIDRKTLERRIRPSAWEYAKICKENKLIL